MNVSRFEVKQFFSVSHTFDIILPAPLVWQPGAVLPRGKWADVVSVRMRKDFGGVPVHRWGRAAGQAGSV